MVLVDQSLSTIKASVKKLMIISIRSMEERRFEHLDLFWSQLLKVVDPETINPKGDLELHNTISCRESLDSKEFDCQTNRLLTQ